MVNTRSNNSEDMESVLQHLKSMNEEKERLRVEALIRLEQEIIRND